MLTYPFKAKGVKLLVPREKWSPLQLKMWRAQQYVAKRLRVQSKLKFLGLIKNQAAGVTAGKEVRRDGGQVYRWLNRVKGAEKLMAERFIKITLVVDDHRALYSGLRNVDKLLVPPLLGEDASEPVFGTGRRAWSVGDTLADELEDIKFLERFIKRNREHIVHATRRAEDPGSRSSCVREDLTRVATLSEIVTVQEASLALLVSQRADFLVTAEERYATYERKYRGTSGGDAGYLWRHWVSTVGKFQALKNMSAYGKTRRMVRLAAGISVD